MDALDYEYFILNAFKYAFKRDYGIVKNLGRGQDPAGLGEASYVSYEDPDNIEKAKIGICYSIGIYLKELNEIVLSKEDYEEYNYLNSFIKRIISAKNYEEVLKIQKEFVEKVFNKYYNLSDGIITLK
ncbi:hypothetical protein [Marinitoga sp. 1155]|uniref:hypothetical protein n=1 Tax=Marinitoga sp. 1155 TaxID=1428448 RepID=UPI0006417E26|nr:hypothetical protein [Marinitoga sp. 1155]KLO24771.1 hypothetical protein X274_02095 [Marinitoga sp. 1155]